ncbi:SDR family oxidoreductase [Hydrogenophaga sp. 2FB]|uniref:NAD-dependent epimerase/dehydratase family protein n=1 Tax=Hydrogenophaga sp. 2FB TaxID=2502187 RepID=UPI00207BA9E2|nr:SDR family oxidoreductase [Hydrogenophaga sp. 2FB]
MTGALGCIGAWVVRRLVRENVPVVALDAASDMRRLRLLMNDTELSRVEVVQGDITNFDLLQNTLDAHGVTHVIHLAAILHPQFKSAPPLGARVNVLGGVNLFEAAAQRGQQIQRIVHASSIAVYDRSDASDGTAIGHHAVGRPTTLYGVFKQAEEAMARVYFQDRGVSSIGLRPATVFGVGRDYGLTSAPTEAVLAVARGKSFHIPYGGRSHFHYADDLAAIFIASARAEYSGAEVFNICGTTAQMHEVVEAIEAVEPGARGSISFGGPVLPLPEDYDASALEAVIGALPRTPLRGAFHETLEILRQNIANGTVRGS